MITSTDRTLASRQPLEGWTPSADILLSNFEICFLGSGGELQQCTEVALRARDTGFRTALSHRDPSGALLWLPHGRALAVIDAWHRCTDITLDELRVCLAENWAHAEYPHQFGVRRLVRLLKAAGFFSDEPGIVRPMEPMTVYRGAPSERRLGMSWSMSLDTAIWFAERYNVVSSVGRVFVAEVPPQHVLAILKSRSESEVVVNPRGLRNVREMPT